MVYIDERISKPEIAIIPAQYCAGNCIACGYESYSGGSFTLFDGSLSGYDWRSNVAGKYIQFKFYGSFVNVIFSIKGGIANIYIDDMTTPYAIVDTSTLEGPHYNCVWVGPQNLTEDYHTIRIEVSSGSLYVVGIMVDPKYNAWRIRPFPNSIDRNLDLAAYAAKSSGSGIYANIFPAFKAGISTTTTLAANGEWTSSSVDCLGARPYTTKIYIICYSDVDGTIYVEYSPDNSNWDGSESISYTGGSTPAITPVKVKGRYARIRYVNGATAQTTFRLYAHFMSD